MSREERVSRLEVQQCLVSTIFFLESYSARGVRCSLW